MPASDSGSTGGVSNAPMTAPCPRGSPTIARRRASNLASEVVAPLGHRLSGGLRKALENDSRRLPFGMGVDDANRIRPATRRSSTIILRSDPKRYPKRYSRGLKSPATF